MPRSKKHSSRRRRKNSRNKKIIIVSAILCIAILTAILFWPEMDAKEEQNTNIKVLPLSQIMEKYYENAGGLKQLEAMRSIHMILEIESPTSKVRMQIFKKAPSYLRIQVEDKNGRSIQAFDGERAWGKFPTMSENSYVWLKDEIASSLKKQTQLLPNLVKYREKGHKARLKGLSEVKGQKVYEIELNLVSGEKEIYYLDADTFREAKVVTINETSQTEQYFSDYELHDGFWVAMKSEVQNTDQTLSTINITQARFNVGILKKAFQNPSHNYKKAEIQ